MGIFIDIAIILIMIIAIYLGYRKGLIKVAISFLSVIVSILIALVLYRPIAQQIMNNSPLEENISNSIYEKIKDIDFTNISEEDKNNGILNIAEKQIKMAMEKSVEDTARFVSDNLSITIVEGITFIGLIIALRLILLVLNLLADFVGNLPIVRQFNKSGGIIYGIIEGFIIINVLLAIAYIINQIYGDGNIQKNIQQSILGEMIYENNFITNTIIK